MTDARHARRSRTVLLPLIVVVLGLALLASSLVALVPVLQPSVAAALPGAPVADGFEASGTAPDDFVADDAPAAVVDDVDDTPAVSPKWLQDRPKKKPKPVKIAVPASVEIPSIGVQSRLIKLGLNADRSLQVPQSYTLAGWYTKGAKPGEKGPAVLVGHYDSVDGPGVFYRLTELQPGQQVRVPRADGTVATFAVDKVERFSKGEFPTERVYGKVAKPELRLITCGGAFNYRTRHYEDNVVVFASLT